jgi:hypothetical protein
VVNCQNKNDAFNVNSPHCGRRGSESKEKRQDEFIGLGIVGGTFSRPKDWPWMVCLINKLLDSNKIRNYL